MFKGHMYQIQNFVINDKLFINNIWIIFHGITRDPNTVSVSVPGMTPCMDENPVSFYSVSLHCWCHPGFHSVSARFHCYTISTLPHIT